MKCEKCGKKFTALIEIDKKLLCGYCVELPIEVPHKIILEENIKEGGRAW
jgi:hypothetical protein